MGYSGEIKNKEATLEVIGPWKTSKRMESSQKGYLDRRRFHKLTSIKLLLNIGPKRLPPSLRGSVDISSIIRIYSAKKNNNKLG